MKIPLVLDRDAAFFVRAIEISSSSPPVAVGLLGPGDAPLVDPLLGGNPPALLSNVWSDAGFNNGIVALAGDDWGLYVAAGGSLSVYLCNPTAAGVTISAMVELHGVKRYLEGRLCRA